MSEIEKKELEVMGATVPFFTILSEKHNILSLILQNVGHLTQW